METTLAVLGDDHRSATEDTYAFRQTNISPSHNADDSGSFRDWHRFVDDAP